MTPSRFLKYRLSVMTLLLLLITLSRTIWIDDIAFDIDETRTAMRAMGTLVQTFIWQPSDWPPLYNLLVNLWQQAVSPHPVILRISSILLFLPAVPLAFRAAQRITGSERAAWGSALVYAATGFSVFLSLYLRAYVLALTLFPLLLILTDEYFERRSVQWRPGLALGITIALLFYTTYTALIAFGIVGLYTLLRYRHIIWRWWLPVLLSALLVLPELLYKLTSLQTRIEEAAPAQSYILPVPEFLDILLHQSFGQGMWIWLSISVLAIALLLWHRRDTLTAWLLIGLLAAPLILYLMLYLQLYRIISARYVWWVSLLLAILLGAGLAKLPTILWGGVAMPLVLFSMFLPIPLDKQHPTKTDFLEKNLIWLNDHLHSGDVLYFDDTQCFEDCFFYDRWVYYGDVLLDNRLQVVSDPADAQRVWYIHTDGRETPASENAVRDGRLPGIFYGPWQMLMQLYEGPPDPRGIRFGEHLRFHGMQWLDDDGQPADDNIAPREQTDATVRLWWSVDETPPRPLSTSLRLISDAGIVLQDDRTPAATSLNPAIELDLPPDMTGWEPGQFYVETRTLSIPSLEDKFQARLTLTVYQWWDNTRLAVAGALDDGSLLLDELQVIGW